MPSRKSQSIVLLLEMRFMNPCFCPGWKINGVKWIKARKGNKLPGLKVKKILGRVTEFRKKTLFIVHKVC